MSLARTVHLFWFREVPLSGSTLFQPCRGPRESTLHVGAPSGSLAPGHMATSSPMGARGHLSAARVPHFVSLQSLMGLSGVLLFNIVHALGF